MLGIDDFYSHSEVPCLWFLPSFTSACHSRTGRVGLYDKSTYLIPHRLNVTDHMHMKSNMKPCTVLSHHTNHLQLILPKLLKGFCNLPVIR